MSVYWIVLSVILPGVIMLSVIKIGVIILSVVFYIVMLNAIMLSVVMQNVMNVVAPCLPLLFFPRLSFCFKIKEKELN